MKNSKLVIFLSCLVAATLTAPRVTAAAHGGGFSGGHSFAGRPGMGMWHGGDWHHRFDHHDHFHHHDVIFIGDFGFPWWWGWGYPYGYYGYGDPYGYGYGYGYGDSSGSRVAELQRQLARAGYYHGSIDGILGPQTRRAIRAYERDHGSAS